MSLTKYLSSILYKKVISMLGMKLTKDGITESNLERVMFWVLLISSLITGPNSILKVPHKSKVLATKRKNGKN